MPPSFLLFPPLGCLVAHRPLLSEYRMANWRNINFQSKRAQTEGGGEGEEEKATEVKAETRTGAAGCSIRNLVF
jgi:hypothetical protein